MIRTAVVLSFSFAAALACGGSQSQDTTEPGDTHAENPAGDLDVDKNGGSDPGQTDPGGTVPPAPSAPYVVKWYRRGPTSTPRALPCARP